LLQTFPDPALEIKTTVPPWQNVVGPAAVTVGVEGDGFTVTATGADVAELHPFATAITVKLPVVDTVMEGEVAPLLQMFPFGALETRVTFPPAQNVVGPLGVIKGVEGTLLTVTTTGVDVAELHPFATSITV
jgi:hypothetical protein